MSVGERIAAYMADYGIPKSFIARKIGISEQSLGQSLLGKRKLGVEEYRKICIALRKDPNFFMDVYTEETA